MQCEPTTEEKAIQFIERHTHKDGRLDPPPADHEQRRRVCARHMAWKAAVIQAAQAGAPEGGNPFSIAYLRFLKSAGEIDLQQIFNERYPAEFAAEYWTDRPDLQERYREYLAGLATDAGKMVETMNRVGTLTVPNMLLKLAERMEAQQLAEREGESIYSKQFITFLIDSGRWAPERFNEIIGNMTPGQVFAFYWESPVVQTEYREYLEKWNAASATDATTPTAEAEADRKKRTPWGKIAPDLKSFAIRHYEETANKHVTWSQRDIYEAWVKKIKRTTPNAECDRDYPSFATYKNWLRA